MGDDKVKQVGEIGHQLAKLAREALKADEDSRFGCEVKIVELVRLASAILEDA